MRGILVGIFLVMVMLLSGGVFAAEYNLAELKTETRGNIIFYMDTQGRPLTGTVREYYVGGGIKNEGQVVAGKRNGLRRDYAQNGTLLAEVEFKEGLRDGISREYDGRGQIKAEWSYQGHIKNGPMREYQQGILVAETVYTKGIAGERRLVSDKGRRNIAVRSSVKDAGKGSDNGIIPLLDIPIRAFAAAKAPAPKTFTPSFKERRFALVEASNFPAVEQRLGGLTEAQKNHLEEHRFLLVPKKTALGLFADSEEGQLFDEMLSNFDGIGGPGEPLYRKPEHAVLLGPDVFLQALHTYFSQRLKGLEKSELSTELDTLLTNLYANAKTLRSRSEGEAALHWQRLQTQILVPLILLKNCEKPKNQGGDNPQEIPADTSDTLASALKIFATYSADLTPLQVAAVETELERIYVASGQHPSQLGLVSTYDAEGVIDYTQFKARGHYEASSITRAYFRAMIWLGQVGWNLKTEEGLADSVNFALSMSFDHQGKSTHRQAWQYIMEISSFFVGYPDAPAYPEWQRFLTQHSGSGLTAHSAIDRALLQVLAVNLDKIPSPKTPFASLQEKRACSVLTVFPQRFTIPWLVGDRLTYHDSLRPNLPALFSALWVPALMGSSFADSLLLAQVKISLAAQPNASLEGAPQAVSAGGLTPLQAEYVSRASEYQAHLKKEMAELASALKAERPENWFSSIGSAWFHLLGTLTASYGDGYPLYMRDFSFGAKQLESFLGGFTALKHDTLLYEKPNYAEMGGGDDEGEIPPVPKGFVEPNLPFWNALLGVVSVMEGGFRRLSLYPKDLEEYGALGQFKAALKLCTALAEKELRGQTLTEQEYEAIRTLQLHYMAQPIDDSILTSEETLSGLIVDVQTANVHDLTGAKPVIVYEALADPYLMLALVGNEDSPRVVVGMAFNHREFITPYGDRLTDSDWKKRVYGVQTEDWKFNLQNATQLPTKNFWYDSLRP